MKIASLAPQFVIEAPVSAEEAEREATVREISDLKMGQAQPVAASSDQSLEKETRAGLLRLAELLRQQSQKDRRQQSQTRTLGQKQAHERTKPIHRGISTYQSISNAWDESQNKGLLFRKTG